MTNENVTVTPANPRGGLCDNGYYEGCISVPKAAQDDTVTVTGVTEVIIISAYIAEANNAWEETTISGNVITLKSANTGTLIAQIMYK